MIRVQGVSKEFRPDQNVLSNLDLKVEKGEWVWVLGATGVGKSVLIKTIYGVLAPSEGKILVLDTDVASLKAKDLAKLRQRLGIVFQDIRLLDDRSVLDNIVLILQALGAPVREARERAEHWLGKVGMNDYLQRCPYELSTGQRQKVALARSLAKQPEVLLLDEPFSALDEIGEREMLKLLGEVNHAGATILAVSHMHETLRFLPGRILQLKEGTLQ